MSDFDWRADEIQRQVIATRDNLALHDRTLASLERDLQIALAAEGEFRADVRVLEGQRFALRQNPPVQVIDADGFERRGASPDAQREYDRLSEAIKAREAEYRRWVDAREVNYSDGVLAQSWSPRNPISVQQRIQRLRVGRAVLANELEKQEARLTPGQLLQIGGTPAPADVEHVGRIGRFRDRIETKAGAS